MQFSFNLIYNNVTTLLLLYATWKWCVDPKFGRLGNVRIAHILFTLGIIPELSSVINIGTIIAMTLCLFDKVKYFYFAMILIPVAINIKHIIDVSL